MRIVVLSLAGAVVLAACGSSTPRSSLNTAYPSESVSATGAPQCAATYHSTSSGSTVAITTSIAGKLDISVAAVGGADEQTVASLPGVVHVSFRETALETLAVTLHATNGPTYRCSVTPA